MKRFLLSLITIFMFASFGYADVQKVPINEFSTRVMKLEGGFYTEIGAGINYQKDDGSWASASAGFQPSSRQNIDWECYTTHNRVGLKNDISSGTYSVFSQIGKDGQILKSKPVALAYLNTETKEWTIIANIQSSMASVSGNKIFYKDAFKNCDLEYIIEKDRLKQNVYIKSLVGFSKSPYDADKTQVVVVTKFDLDNFDTPKIVDSRGEVSLASMKEASVTAKNTGDETLDGEIRFSKQTFGMCEATDASGDTQKILKRIIKHDGNYYLLEGLPYSWLASAGYTAPDNTNIGNIYSIVNHVTYGNSAIQTLIAALNDIAASDVVTAMQAVAGDFKADVSGLATSAALATTDGKVDSILEDTGTTIPGLIGALNNISAGDVWDVTLSSHLGAGSTGNALNAAGSAGDPWATTIPGAYGAGSAGYIVGTYLDAAMSSRLATAGYTAPDNTNIGNIYSIVNSGTYGNSALKTLVDALQADLNNPDQYKADVSGLATASGLTSAFTEIKGATWSSVTDTLEAIRDRGDAAWLTATGFPSTSDIWTYVSRSLTDKAGFTISGTKTTLDALNDITAASVWANSTRLLTAGTNIVLAKGVGVTGFNDISATDVWQTNVSAYSGAGYAGTYLKGIYDKLPAGSMLSDTIWTGTKAGYLDALISSRSTLTAQNVWEYATRALTDKAGFTISGTKTTLDSLNDITAASVWSSPTRTLSAFSFSVNLAAAAVDAIWDELKAGHTVSDSFGSYLDSKVSEAGGGALTAAAVADAVWDEALSGHVSSGTAGRKLNETASEYNVGP